MWSCSWACLDPFPLKRFECVDPNDDEYLQTHAMPSPSTHGEVRGQLEGTESMQSSPVQSLCHPVLCQTPSMRSGKHLRDHANFLVSA